jgi:exoribonuclease R
LAKEYSIPDLIPKNSYDYVAFLMILMNIHCADELDEHGIMRRVVGSSSSSIPPDLPEEVKSYLKRKQETLYGEYVAFKDSDDLYHSLLKVEAYAHITSPIRRLVDIVNLTNLHLDILSFSAKDFCKKWILQIELINQTCRNIKLVESNCQLLYECNKNKTYVGYIIKKEQRESGKELKNDLKDGTKELKTDLKDWVYIPVLKLTTKLYQTTKEYEEYAKIKVKPIIIVKEFTAYKKVRLIPV